MVQRIKAEAATSSAKGAASGAAAAGQANVKISVKPFHGETIESEHTFNVRKGTPFSKVKMGDKDNFKYVLGQQVFEPESSDWFYNAKTIECSEHYGYDVDMFHTGTGTEHWAQLGFGCLFLVHLALILFVNSWWGRSKGWYRRQDSQGFRSTTNSAAGSGNERSGNRDVEGNAEAIGDQAAGTDEDGNSGLRNRSSPGAGSSTDALESGTLKAASKTNKMLISLRKKVETRQHELDFFRLVCVCATATMHTAGERFSDNNTGLCLHWVMPFLFIISGLGFSRMRMPAGGGPKLGIYIAKLCIISLIGMGLNMAGLMIEYNNLKGDPDRCVTLASIGQMWYVLCLLIISLLFWPVKGMLDRVNMANRGRAGRAANADAAEKDEVLSSSSAGELSDSALIEQRRPMYKNPNKVVSAVCFTVFLCLTVAGCVVAFFFIKPDNKLKENIRQFTFLVAEQMATLSLICAGLMVGDRGYLTWIVGSWVFLAPAIFPWKLQFFSQLAGIFLWAATVEKRPLYGNEKLKLFFWNYWPFMVLLVLGLTYPDQRGRCDLYPAGFVGERVRFNLCTAIFCAFLVSGALHCADPFNAGRWVWWWTVSAYVSMQFWGNVFAKIGPGKFFGAVFLYLTLIPVIIACHWIPRKATTSTQTGADKVGIEGDSGGSAEY
ncbi:unnamed protein product [Amoebophrya sp. A25]|nr:unnamed protein product [Amoebophrya sp. A25]|eukprot:GSA25T00020131001.1